MSKETEKTNKVGQADVASVLKTTASKNLDAQVKKELEEPDPDGHTAAQIMEGLGLDEDSR